MKKKTLRSSILMLVLFALVPFISQAQTSTLPNEITDNVQNQAVVIATVNIYDAKIVSQENNNITMSFDINNRDGAQPGIKYAVSLVKKINDNERELIDQKVYDEVLSLSENTTINKEITYEAPGYLAGIYEILIMSQTESGLPLGSNSAGEVNLAGDDNYVDISSCYLSIQNESSGKKYSIEQGVNIDPDEKILISCSAKNNFKTNQRISPKFVSYYRDMYGEKLTDNESAEAVDLKAGEEKKIKYIIPINWSKSQSYDNVLTFANENGDVVSNKTFFRYVINGNNATIQSVKLDKDYYSKGEVASVSFFVTSFNVGSVFMELSLKSNNQNCSDVVLKELNGGGQGDVKMTITNECVNPEIFISVKDKEGVVLDQTSQKVISNMSLFEESSQATPVNSKQGIFSLAIFLAILMVALFVLLKKAKNKSVINSFIIFILIGLGMFFGGSDIAKGDTIKVGTYWPGGITLCSANNTCIPTFVYTVNTDKASYSVGENVSAEASLNVYPSGNQNAIYNHPPAGCYLLASGLSGGSVCVINVYNFLAINAHFKYYTDVANLGTSSVAGNKAIAFSAIGYDYNGSLNEWKSNSSSTVYYNKTINFTVSANNNSSASITDPIITGPTSGVVNTDYDFNVVSSGVNNINYYIDWNDDGIADQETVQINGNFYTFSQPGVLKTVTHKWNSSGKKTFAVRAAGPLRFGHDDTMMKTTASYLSGVVRYTINICNVGDHYDETSGSCISDNIPIVPPALIPSSGECGDSGSKSSCKAPTTNLCSSGSLVSPVKLVDNKWTWECKGKDGGQSASCSAIKDCSWTEVNP